MLFPISQCCILYLLLRVIIFELLVMQYILQVIDVQRSKVNMLGSKVEVHLRKAEAGSWQSLDVPRQSGLPPPQTNTVPNPENKSCENQDDTVDLSDL
jgi:hypothetical protein